MNNPIVSVIIPCFNCEDTIERALNSILKQTITDLELVIIDDGSVDNTSVVIKDFIAKHPELRSNYLKQENIGPSATRNKGLECAKGNYIAFLDSDDVWHPCKLNTQIELMKKHDALISGSYHKILDNGNFLDYCNEQVNSSSLKYNWVKWPKILFKTPFATPSVILHKTLKKYRFDESLERGEDYDLWKRIVYSNSALKIEYPLVATFKHNYISDKDCLSSSPISMQRDLNKSDIKMLKSKTYSKTDKGLILLALIFSQIKFIKRLIVSIFHGMSGKLK